MDARLPLRTACVLGALPCAVLATLCGAGELGWAPGLVGIGVVLAGALLLAMLWVRDVERVVAALAEAPGSVRRPLFSATARIADGAERLRRAVGAREAEVAAVAEAERALVRRLPDPLIVLGPGRAVQRTNAAAERAFGPGIAAVLRHPGLRAAIDRALAEGQVQSAELSLPMPSAREVFATVIPLQPPLADGGRIVAVLSDRTRERAVERMRADFVANASHELRTPLASVIGFIDTLRGPARDDPPAQARFLDIMAEQAQRMNRLIDDLLSLSRIELTEHQAPGELVEVPELIRRLVAAFEPQMRGRRMTVAMSCPGELPPVAGDEDQLEQVMQNLLDNAMKYGREGGTMRVAVQPAPPGPPWPARPGVAISVTDDGPGIARAHLPRLTERFYRADKSRSRAVGGTGLGLAIVKHIVNRHRGQLAIESTEGEGTTVTVWLPAGPVPGAVGAGSGGGARA